jgi:hypothetical protein
MTRTAPASPTARHAVSAGRITITVDAPPGATVASTPGKGVVRIVVSGLDTGQSATLALSKPVSAHLELLGDLSVAVVEDSTTLGGFAPIDTDTVASEADVATPHVSGRTLTVTTDGDALVTSLGVGTPRSATWGTHDGGRSLAVDPNTWARAAGQAGADATWSAVIAAHPDANTPGMHDQLTCHSIGAPTKATWNLEPWRPDVGLLATIAARCNP